MKTIEINGQQIDIIMERKKVKNINLRVRKGKIYISANKKVPEGYIFDFVNQNRIFIEKAVCKETKKLRYSIASLEQNPKETIFLFGERYEYKYLMCRDKSLEVTQNIMTIKSPTAKIGQDVLESYLKERLSEYIDEINIKIYNIFKNYGVMPPIINYRKMKSRWGSCYYNSQKIFLNTALATAPKQCIEYVLFHEYTHFLYPNHQKEFYSFLSRYIPEYKQIKSYLNAYEKC